ncbi:MAG: GTP cyclohydrolase I FolE [Firmicutes bacterium]|nr:GTP cyclohydrolase I FolE [Bacillota bacterium]
MQDSEKIKKAAELLLEAINEDKKREGLKDTPSRIADMYEELFSEPCEISALFEKTFFVKNNDMVIEKDITFYSMCEHHIMPFFGKIAIGYIPDGKVLGLSKLARIVEHFSKRLQLQERLCAQIADAIFETLKPKGVIIYAEAEHLCMTMRGVKKPGSKTITLYSLGDFKLENLKTHFLSLIK